MTRDKTKGVEPYRLTSEMKGLVDRAKVVVKTRRALEMRLRQSLTEVQRLSQMLQEVTQQGKRIQQNLPLRPVKELEGQDTSGRLRR